MNNEEPLLKEKEEKILMGDIGLEKEDSSPVGEPIVQEKKAIEEKTEDIVKKEDLEPPLISKPMEDRKEEKKETINYERKGKKIVPIIITLVLTAMVVYLLVQTCMGFYYGFKYRNYEEPITSEKQ